MIASDVAQLEVLLRTNQRPCGEKFSDAEVALLTKYYEIVLKWNARLHLTTLTQPQAFFERHILESAFAESLILPIVTQVWDIGSGLGIPGLVIAILRQDLDVHLVEARKRKAVFLEQVIDALKLPRVTAINSRFESFEKLPPLSCLTVRAIEGMERLIPEILALAEKSSQILIFGSEKIGDRVRENLTGKKQMKILLIPGSDRRWIIEVSCST